MTVAIAAICDVPNAPMIVAAEDRMITAGDVEFQQPQPKGYQFGERCIAFIYGEVDAHGHIASRVSREVRSEKILAVEGIAECYGRHMREYVRKRAENEILAPLGLTHESFLATHQGMSEELVKRLQDRLQNYYWDRDIYKEFGGAIIAGTDGNGAHLYQVEHGQVNFMTGVGFVAAGSGKRHAESQFMFSRFTRNWGMSETIALVHRAKKRAEVAPGVGAETDMVAITGAAPYIFHYPPTNPMLGHLEAFYQDAELKRAKAEMEEAAAVREMMSESAKNQQAKSAPQPEAPQALPAGDETDR